MYLLLIREGKQSLIWKIAKLLLLRNPLLLLVIKLLRYLCIYAKFLVPRVVASTAVRSVFKAQQPMESFMTDGDIQSDEDASSQSQVFFVFFCLLIRYVIQNEFIFCRSLSDISFEFANLRF